MARLRNTNAVRGGLRPMRSPWAGTRGDAIPAAGGTVASVIFGQLDLPSDAGAEWSYWVEDPGTMPADFFPLDEDGSGLRGPYPDGFYWATLQLLRNDAVQHSFPLYLAVGTVAGPSVDDDPASLSIPQGGSVTLTVVASGPAVPLTYSWRRNGLPIAGATGPSLTFAANAWDDGAAYTVAITDALGRSVTSAAATLTVTAAPESAMEWIDWSNELMMFLPDAPVPTVMQALQRSAAAYFRATRSMRDDPADVASTTQGLEEYEVTVPEQRILIGVVDAKIGDTDAVEVEADASLPLEREAADADADAVIGVASESSIRIWPPATADDIVIRATLAYTIADTATGLPESLYRRHRIGINAMALDFMLSMQGKPWSNPAEAARYRKIAQAERLTAGSRAGRRSATARLRVKSV